VSKIFEDFRNKRTAIKIIEELMVRNKIEGTTSSILESVVSRVGVGELKEIDDIARALQGFVK